MADDTFRSYRNRDAAAPRSAGAAERWQSDDPLAELARLIGQSEPMPDRRPPQRAPALDDSAQRDDWAAQDGYADDSYPDDRYGGQAVPADENYDAGDDADYEPPRQADVRPSYRAGARLQDRDYEPQIADPASAPRSNGSGAYVRDLAVSAQPRYRDMQEPAENTGRKLSAVPPRFPDEIHDHDDAAQDVADDPAYALEDYAEETPNTRRRGGLVAIAAVLGLAVLGTAGAFGYRAMFGSSMLPALPPIIKADSGPTKIVPKPKASASELADAGKASSGEKLVPREEQPVVMPTPNPAPHVVATVPIFPDPNSVQAGVPPTAQEGVQSGVLATGTAGYPAPPPVAVNAAAGQPSSIWPPVPSTAPVPGAAATNAAPPVGATDARKVHTVIIHTNELASADASAMPAPTAAPAPAEPSAAPVRTASPHVQAAPRVAVQARPAPVARADGNAPLSIIPDQRGAEPRPAPARVRTASARSAEPSAPARSEATSATGGYAIQVTSQRSEADAQAEFRALRAKYPTQLGGHEPIIRRADLGAKGVYYRALVGPFSSEEEAASACSRLKAAGGSCLVQRI